MNWNKLTHLSQLEQIIKESGEQPVLIFKHSTRCPISSTSLNRLERNWRQEDLQTVKPYFLDLISYREISNAIAQKFQVEHQSPQVLLIQNGESFFDKSHLDIDYHSIKDALGKLN
jgi:bacillithiol system protein YtxJ